MANPFFKKIENFFHIGTHDAGTAFTAVEQEAVKDGLAAVHFLEQNGGKVLRDAATTAVIAVETTAGGGEAKAAAAFAQIAAVLVAEGIPVVKAAVKLAIEMALAKAKEAGLIATDPKTPAPDAAPKAA